MKLSMTACALAVLLATFTLGGCAKSSKASSATATPASSTELLRDPVLDAYIGAMRADLSAGKVGIINGVMGLSAEEAQVFWPLYREYESELFDMGDKRIDLIRRFAAAQTRGQLLDAAASELGDSYFALEQEQLDLRRKYHDIIAEELSPTRAAQFTQIEHRVATIVDLAIASEMPLIELHKGN
jgi:hypothetical protein